MIRASGFLAIERQNCPSFCPSHRACFDFFQKSVDFTLPLGAAPATLPCGNSCSVSLMRMDFMKSRKEDRWLD